MSTTGRGAKKNPNSIWNRMRMQNPRSGDAAGPTSTPGSWRNWKEPFWEATILTYSCGKPWP